MASVMKAFLGIFFFALVVFLGVGIVDYQSKVSSAQSYQRDVIAELQNSDFSPSVMNACIKAGEKRKYEVSIEVTLEDGQRKTYGKGHPAEPAAVVAAYVTVAYQCRLPFLGIETKHQLRGFAR